jgi:hypothetical protein
LPTVLRASLEAGRPAERDVALLRRPRYSQLTAETFEVTEDDRYLDFTLSTMAGSDFSGQVVRRKGELVYASICARPKYLYA